MKNIYSSLFTVLLVSIFGFQSYSQCYGDLHTPFYEDGWLSCQVQENPNPVHGPSHWIMYNLGYEYTLDSSYVWNYNTWGLNDRGMKDVIIDYSLDGVTWTNLGTYQFEEASGSIKYEGFKGPDFGGIKARYVLLTATSNWGDEGCVGLAELKIHVSDRTTSTDPDLDLEMVSIDVIPNPVISKAEISILSEGFPERIALYDLAGQVLSIQNNPGSKNVSFDLATLPAGIYVVKAWVDNTIASAKIVKVGF